MVFDNEPRNKELLKQVEKAINRGHKICLWPEGMEYKDINDMILGGYTKEEIQDLIKHNTYQGTAATLWFTKWRKINAQ